MTGQRATRRKYLTVAAASGGCLLLIAIVSLRLFHESTVSNRPPITAEILNTISAQLADRARIVAMAIPADLPTENADDVNVPPTRLKRCATVAEIDARWAARKRCPYATTATRVFLSKITEGALRAAGVGDEAVMLTCKIGRDMMELGKHDEAREHFETVLNDASKGIAYPEYYVRYAAGQLAWMEADPDKSMQLLALSCQPGPSPSDAGNHLVGALELAELTGSEDSANEFRGRLQREAPHRLHEYVTAQSNPAPTGEERTYRWQNVLYLLPDL